MKIPPWLKKTILKNMSDLTYSEIVGMIKVVIYWCIIVGVVAFIYDTFS